MVESSATTGTHLSVALENNPKSYPYADQDWQAFAAHCAKLHIAGYLKHDLDKTSIKPR